MLCTELRKFARLIPKDKCIMSLDLGEKKIGIAFSDRNNLIATPHSIYYRRNVRKDIGFLNRLFLEGDAGCLIVGLPLALEDEEKPWCKAILSFVNKIIKKYNVIVYLQDESFSTVAANEILAFAGLSCQKAKKLGDKISASIILQRTLDAINK